MCFVHIWNPLCYLGFHPHLNAMITTAFIEMSDPIRITCVSLWIRKYPLSQHHIYSCKNVTIIPSSLIKFWPCQWTKGYAVFRQINYFFAGCNWCYYGVWFTSEVPFCIGQKRKRSSRYDSAWGWGRCGLMIWRVWELIPHLYHNG